eukprot:m.58954 g.58954  ORF g.58954 m.58954 type:complete len:1085 (+) comp11738_c0_seq1:374-3628(+)
MTHNDIMRSVFVTLACLVAAVSSQSFTDFPRPSFTEVTESCNFYPQQPPALMAAPPARVDVCSDIQCPKAPNQCYFDSQCRDGFCFDFVPRPLGAWCDDNDVNTANDICDGSGQCVGAKLTCPADQTKQLKAGRGTVFASWNEPTAKYGGVVSFTMSGTVASGSQFREGETEVVYTATAVGPNGAIEMECSFYITVLPACDMDCCDMADGTYASGAVGTVDFPTALDAYEAFFNPSDRFTCYNELSVCDSPRAFLPRPMPRAPPLAPKHFPGRSDSVRPTIPVTTTSTTTTTTTSTTTEGVSTSAYCEFRQLDVAFVLDASGSVGVDNFDIVRDFIADTVRQLDVGASKVRVAGMQFHSFPLPEFDFDDSFDRNTVANRIASFDYDTSTNWGTATGAALNYVTDSLLTPAAGYRGAGGVVYMVTDGVSLESATTVSDAANRLKATGVAVVVIGITPNVDLAQLNVIASSADDVYVVADFADLDAAIREDLVNRVCDPNSLPVTTTTSSPVTTDTPTEECQGRLTSISAEACTCGGNCHTCDWDAGVAGTCNICKNEQYLYNGRCVSRCPVGYIEDGSGSFGRLCVLVPTTSAPHDTTAYTGEVCAGTTTVNSLESCRCQADCHTCQYPEGVASHCMRCKNEQYLLNGDCVDSCPANYDAMGTGSFGRYCQYNPPTTTVATTTTLSGNVCTGRLTQDAQACACQADCYSCRLDGANQPTECLRCKNEQYLLNGECVDGCPVNYDAIGFGSFGRECQLQDGATPAPTDAPTTTYNGEQCVGRLTLFGAQACICNDDCHTCQYEGSIAGMCTRCKNEQYLYNGECLASCPVGYVEAGSGSFGRSCEREQAPTTAAPTTTPGASDWCAGRLTVNTLQACRCEADCHTCAYDGSIAGACARCKNEAYLFNGECIDTCPEGYVGEGTGSFDKYCRELGVTTTSAAPATRSNETTTYSGEICTARLTESLGQACDCESNCYSCAFAGSFAGACFVCKNSFYLYSGTCVETCPAGYTAIGDGNFNRECVQDRRRSVASLEATSSSALMYTLYGGVLVMLVVASAIVVRRKQRRSSQQPAATLPAHLEEEHHE